MMALVPRRVGGFRNKSPQSKAAASEKLFGQLERPSLLS